LYAAYAYAQAGLTEQVRSVGMFMRSDLQADIFDVAMLAGELAGRDPADSAALPFCPMLSQGWELLRVRRTTLPHGFDDAREFVRPALWTTLEPPGVDRALAVLKKGVR
jgi:hypothetical protein